MAKLSLSEVSKQFNVDRSTIYRAVRNGRLSRSSDGQFDIAEVIGVVSGNGKYSTLRFFNCAQWPKFSTTYLGFASP